MKEKLNKLCIDKRLSSVTNITLILSAASMLICYAAVIITLILYGYVIDNFALPQGDVGQSLSHLTNMRSATRGIVGFTDPDLVKRFGEEYAKSKKDMEDALTVIYGTIVTDVGQRDFDNIIAKYDKYCTDVKPILELGATNDPEARARAQELLEGDIELEYQEAYNALKGLMETNTSLVRSERAKSRAGCISFMVIALIIAIISGYYSLKLNKYVAETIVLPLNALGSRFKKFKDGDLATEFPVCETDDEISELIDSSKVMSDKLTEIIKDLIYLYGQMAEGNFNIKTSCESSYVKDFNPLLLSARQMNNNISNTLAAIKEASDMVSGGAANLADASQAMAEGATEQAASVEELLATIDEISTGIEHTAKELDASSNQAELCMTEAQNSKVEMKQLVEAMNQIQETSREISKIIDDIEDIASQTNLLSLNASIEAARAGEAGRGFAVVAGQIGKLAEDSKRSAKNTRELIEQSISDIDKGGRYVKSTSDVLDHVTALIEEVLNRTETVTQMSKEQSVAAEQVRDGCARIAEIVSNNSATAEETSATSEELSAQAISLDELVGRFKLRK